MLKGRPFERSVRSLAFVTALPILAFLTACTTPKVQPLPAADIIRSDLLSFVRDGVTTREEVLLKLGTPSAQFEGGRILTYQIRVGDDGIARVYWPRRSELHPALTHWEPEIYSLVLVFRNEGVLEKHSLVSAR
ncbi:MAG: hypothetical protein D6760_08370 [Deltaproteobacteria bacterium]|nr:MAG: hypothetical protein D6760_08370 [Deltaproteobacteria bacterium]